MTILVNKDTKIVRTGDHRKRGCLAHTLNAEVQHKILAGVTPGKAGENVGGFRSTTA